MTVSQLADVGIGVTEVARWQTFASEILGLETSTLDDVGSGMDAALRSDATLATTLGRHTNDQMVSFYVVTPSRFEVEYGWGGRLIDDSVWQVRRHDRGALWGHTVQVPTAS